MIRATLARFEENPQRYSHEIASLQADIENVKPKVKKVKEERRDYREQDDY
jgi:FtsZ-binding cell division protein ZapB